MMSSTIKMKEFECPCCGEKFNIKLKENGDFVIIPFILPKEDYTSIGIYDFGAKGGENNE